MTTQQILIAIAAFLTLTIGSFIWFVASWDQGQTISETSLIILPKILPPEAPALQERAFT